MRAVKDKGAMATIIAGANAQASRFAWGQRGRSSLPTDAFIAVDCSPADDDGIKDKFDS